MLFISLITLIIAIALPNVKISPILFTRLTSIIFIYSAALTLNGLYVQSIGSGKAIYSGLFQVTFLTQSIETFIYLLGALILIPWVSIGIENTSLKLYSSALLCFSSLFKRARAERGGYRVNVRRAWFSQKKAEPSWPHSTQMETGSFKSPPSYKRGRLSPP